MTIFINSSTDSCAHFIAFFIEFIFNIMVMCLTKQYVNYSQSLWYHRFYSSMYSCVISINFCSHIFLHKYHGTIGPPYIYCGSQFYWRRKPQTYNTSTCSAVYKSHIMTTEALMTSNCLTNPELIKKLIRSLDIISYFALRIITTYW